MSIVIFNNQSKYFRARKLVRERRGQEGTPEEVLDEYVKMGGSYQEDGVFKNVLGSPRLNEQLARIKKSLEEAKEPVKKMNRRKKPEVKPTVKINRKSVKK